jgi:hypothetical protein
MHSKAASLGIALTLVLTAPLARGEIRIGYGPAGNIARAPDVHGKNIPGQCPFARELHARLQTAGIPSAIIIYAYAADSRLAGPLNAPLSHAVVAYEDRGRTYIMDNQSSTPVWVKKTTLAGMAQRFSGPAIAVRGARIENDRDVSHIASHRRLVPQVTKARPIQPDPQRLATR